MKIISFFFILGLFLPSPIYANLRDLIHEEYEKVEIENSSRIPQSYRLITTTLPLNVFPLLPDSHRWVKEGDDYIVMKHQAAPSHRLEFAVFADHPEFPSTVNYLTIVDGVNVQAFSHTREKGRTFNGKRETYPFTVQEPLIPLTGPHYNLRSQVYLRPYVDGHCIDHADTIFPECINYQHSSADPRNHIPEPYDSYWGLHIRNSLVASIRSERGCYMQIPYYSLKSPITNLGPPVPEGVHFMRFSHHIERGPLPILPQEIYHIPWNDNIHSPKQTEYWNILLERKRANELSHGYLPYFSNLVETDQQWWQKSLATLLRNSPVVQGQCQIYDVRVAENLKMAADDETNSISFKLRHLYYIYAVNQVPPDIRYWQGRALHHADLLFEFQKAPFSSSKLEEAKAVMRQADEDQQDYWRQIISSQEELPSRNLNTANAIVTERKRYNLRSSPHSELFTPQNDDAFHNVEFHKGRGSLTKLKNQPPENLQSINRTKKIWLKEANAKTVKAWLETNKAAFLTLDKSQIEIYYKPCTQQKSWPAIENQLHDSGFTRIFRKSE